jgi:hypothetical protein
MQATTHEFNPSDYATYRYRVTRDERKFTISVMARSEADGRERIRKNQGCPDSAIETLLFSPMKKLKINVSYNE